MEFSLVKFVEVLLLPPGGLILLTLAGLVVLRVSKYWGIGLISTALALFYLLSTPLVSGALMRSLENYPALQETEIRNSKAEAIVILAGGRLRDQPEYGGDTVAAITLQRVRYGAWLKRRTQLPLYVSGGSTRKELKGEAELMQEVLQKEFNVEVNVIENKSKTTYENAKFTAELLNQNGHNAIFLVSNTFHMPRAVEAFQEFGIEVIPAPTGYTTQKKGLLLMDVLPQAFMFNRSYYALHEQLGRLWYNLRYY